MMAIFSIWEGDSITLIRGPGPPVFADGREQEPRAVKVAEFEASTVAEAAQKRNDHCGWGPYTVFDESELEPIEG